MKKKKINSIEEARLINIRPEPTLSLEEIALFDFLCEKILPQLLKKKEYLTVKEAAQMIGCKPDLLQRRIDKSPKYFSKVANPILTEKGHLIHIAEVEVLAAQYAYYKGNKGARNFLGKICSDYHNRLKDFKEEQAAKLQQSLSK